MTETGSEAGMRVLVVIVLVLLAGPSWAKDRGILGWGAILNNDIFGDGEDRWRTGSYTSSYVRGEPWTGALPGRAGAVMEYRFHGELIAPERISRAEEGDRPLVGVLSFGAHTHFQTGGFEIDAGADIVLTGPQTGIGDIQQGLHRATGAPRNRILGTQLPNRLHPTASVEVGRKFRLGDTGTFVRPFGQMQMGVETFARLGADMVIGPALDEALHVRDGVSGQHYPVVVPRDRTGLSLMLGGDLAYVQQSAFLPEDRGYRPERARSRARVGVLYEAAGTGPDGVWLFYGLTYLGPEFEGQSEGQTVASISLNMRF
ncbi:lipid A-modifier LpxR family protein [Algicella marina]|uniref:DUF2219 family protein n=1 Tax=Algicella marina TaxID=2683284 RepID=A0A6P1T6T2_9RHOB|nr:lipid A-modifier LpxR family protein [Algicella marina]QHQ37196.1 DUF2219 family protein [Algicella marina]